MLLGDGPLRAEIAALGDARIHMPGFVTGRAELARWLASADLYVSGMADETFGVSIVEAQASGLPVVGVAAGRDARPGRRARLGRLGPVGDAARDGRQHPRHLDGDRAAMAAAARTVAARYSWDASHGPAVRRCLSRR